MRITPVSKEDADAGGFGDPFKPGEYDFTIAAAEETFSKAGNPMLKLTLHVFDRIGEKRTVFDYILSSEAGAWKARHMMETIGLVKKYEAGEIEPHEIQGRPGLCKLGIEPASGTYPAKNKIVDYVQSAAAAPAAPVSRSLRPAAEARKPVPAGAGGGDLDDEIPFGPCWQ